MRKSMFDLNGDGHLSFIEKAGQYAFMEYIFQNEMEDDGKDVFGDAGLDYEELEMMDPAERRSVLM